MSDLTLKLSSHSFPPFEELQKGDSWSWGLPGHDSIWNGTIEVLQSPTEDPIVVELSGRSYAGLKVQYSYVSPPGKASVERVIPSCDYDGLQHDLVRTRHKEIPADSPEGQRHWWYDFTPASSVFSDEDIKLSSSVPTVGSIFVAKDRLVVDASPEELLVEGPYDEVYGRLLAREYKYKAEDLTEELLAEGYMSEEITPEGLAEEIGLDVNGDAYGTLEMIEEGSRWEILAEDMEGDETSRRYFWIITEEGGYEPEDKTYFVHKNEAPNYFDTEVAFDDAFLKLSTPVPTVGSVLVAKGNVGADWDTGLVGDDAALIDEAFEAAREKKDAELTAEWEAEGKSEEEISDILAYYIYDYEDVELARMVDEGSRWVIVEEDDENTDLWVILPEEYQENPQGEDTLLVSKDEVFYHFTLEEPVFDDAYLKLSVAEDFNEEDIKLFPDEEDDLEFEEIAVGQLWRADFSLVLESKVNWELASPYDLAPTIKGSSIWSVFDIVTITDNVSSSEKVLIMIQEASSKGVNPDREFVFHENKFLNFFELWADVEKEEEPVFDEAEFLKLSAPRIELGDFLRAKEYLSAALDDDIVGDTDTVQQEAFDRAREKEDAENKITWGNEGASDQQIEKALEEYEYKYEDSDLDRLIDEGSQWEVIRDRGDRWLIREEESWDTLYVLKDEALEHFVLEEEPFDDAAIKLSAVLPKYPKTLPTVTITDDVDVRAPQTTLGPADNNPQIGQRSPHHTPMPLAVPMLRVQDEEIETGDIVAYCPGNTDMAYGLVSSVSQDGPKIYVVGWWALDPTDATKDEGAPNRLCGSESAFRKWEKPVEEPQERFDDVAIKLSSTDGVFGRILDYLHFSCQRLAEQGLS